MSIPLAIEWLEEATRTCYYGNKDEAAVPCLSSLGPTRVFPAAVEAHWPARALWTPPSNVTNNLIRVCV